MSEETAVVDTKTSEDTTTDTGQLFSIQEKTLKEFGSLCRTLTNEPNELFEIDEMKEVLKWAQDEALIQQDLINQIQIAIQQKTNEVNTDE